MANPIQAIKQKLAAAGYAASDLIAAHIALLLRSRGGKDVSAMILDGPPGAGKTSLAIALAQVLGVDYTWIQAHPGSCPEDFLYDANIVQILRGIAGDTSAVRSAEDVIELGFLPLVFKASQTGMVVGLVDELDKANPKTDSLFLGALQQGEVVVKGLGRIKANTSNLVVFFTKNNERAVSEPLMRRCRREYLTFPDPALELAILTGKYGGKGLPEAVAQVFITVANQLRAKAEDLIKSPATSELKKGGDDVLLLAEWGAPGLIGQFASGWLAGYQEDRTILKGIMTPERLGELLAMAIKSSAAEINRRGINKADDGFVKI